MPSFQRPKRQQQQQQQPDQDDFLTSRSPLRLVIVIVTVVLLVIAGAAAATVSLATTESIRQRRPIKSFQHSLGRQTSPSYLLGHFTRNITPSPPLGWMMTIITMMKRILLSENKRRQQPFHHQKISLENFDLLPSSSSSSSLYSSLWATVHQSSSSSCSSSSAAYPIWGANSQAGGILLVAAFSSASFRSSSRRRWGRDLFTRTVGGGATRPRPGLAVTFSTPHDDPDNLQGHRFTPSLQLLSSGTRTTQRGWCRMGNGRASTPRWTTRQLHDLALGTQLGLSSLTSLDQSGDDKEEEDDGQKGSDILVEQGRLDGHTDIKASQDRDEVDPTTTDELLPKDAAMEGTAALAQCPSTVANPPDFLAIPWTWTPYQILYHPAVDWKEAQNVAASSLEESLDLIQRAVKVLADVPTAPSADGTEPRSVSLWQNLPTRSSPAPVVLRIEQRVEPQSAVAAIDPLAWLHAQQQHGPLIDAAAQFAQPPGQQKMAFPWMYFANQERTYEAACLGAAFMVNDTNHVFEQHWWSKDDCGSHISPHSNWYGYQRFDGRFPEKEHHRHRNPWTPFGKALWMIPRIELRQTDRYTVLAAHIVLPPVDPSSHSVSQSWTLAARDLWHFLQHVTYQQSPPVPPTTLPPVLSRDSRMGSSFSAELNDGDHDDRDEEEDPEGHFDGQEMFERAVSQALLEFSDTTTTNRTDEMDLSPYMRPSVPPSERLEKVVLARQQTMHFGASFSALEILRRWKYGGHEGGHLFWIKLGSDASGESELEFFGCTPERLFRIKGGRVQSEALAGTRPRGSTIEEDEKLLKELFESPKDRQENLLTGQFIVATLDGVVQQGWAKWSQGGSNASEGVNKVEILTSALSTTGYFVRRLLHLQHICKRYAIELIQPFGVDVMGKVIQQLLTRLHPTPAVCGLPQQAALDFIRKHESVGFDRGLYAGPIGYIGRKSSDLVVGIRSGLLRRQGDRSNLLAYAGVGVVPGSTVQGEWTETNYKFAVISSLFPQSPMTLQNAPTANVAWAMAFVEELIRNGVTKFYVCPGSRSTPLVVAIARAARSYVGVVSAVSVHDERSAAFRAVGYARGSGRPAAVITSSGTAVANLYPAVVEAGMDGIPLLAITADRPYESRETGSNQAIDQVKLFSSSYVRWFRDVIPPSDDIPVSSALSDASHAVYLTRSARGPVHINIQFRENLAPDGGKIRNDARVDSVSKFNAYRFTDVPGFQRWSKAGHGWLKSYQRRVFSTNDPAVSEVSKIISGAGRGVIIVGNVRAPPGEGSYANQVNILKKIAAFAQSVGMPVFAGAQSASMRFCSPAVVPFAENLLKCPIVANNLKPDLIFQIGAPLVSSDMQNFIAASMKENAGARHILLHPHVESERSDPSYTTTHRVDSDVVPFLDAIIELLSEKGALELCSSELSPLIVLGRALSREMKSIIVESSSGYEGLSEPEIILGLAEHFSSPFTQGRSLFLSNSMPIRDAEAFLYPFTVEQLHPKNFIVGTNRGASGIDGIIASATAYAEATEMPTTLVIGDLATIHDIGSMHSIGSDLSGQSQPSAKKRYHLNTVVINNDGGGIFSFLPIAAHGADVGFDEFFGTPTRAFSFEKGTSAFGLTYMKSSAYESLRTCFESMDSSKNLVLEAVALDRNSNVRVHRQITSRVNDFVNRLVAPHVAVLKPASHYVKFYPRQDRDVAISMPRERTILFLHGWMGDRFEWDEVAFRLSNRIDKSWRMLSIDLPGHGDSPVTRSAEKALISSLNLEKDENRGELSVDGMALQLLRDLLYNHKVEKIDAIAGYSLGGRIGLAMKRVADDHPDVASLLDGEPTIILLGAYPGNVLASSTEEREMLSRKAHDDGLARRIRSIWYRSRLYQHNSAESKSLWAPFLRQWYGNSMWGPHLRDSPKYNTMFLRRAQSLTRRGLDLAEVLSRCSPARNSQCDWSHWPPEKTLFICGALDPKYAHIAKLWANHRGISVSTVENAGHGLLTEAPAEVADFIDLFLTNNATVGSTTYRDRAEIESKVDLSSLETQKQDEQQGVLDENIENLLPSDAGTHRLSLELFVIRLGSSGSGRKEGLSGIGWGEKSRPEGTTSVGIRTGFIVEVTSADGNETGLGEVSPLVGVHTESLEEAESQLRGLQNSLRQHKLDCLPDQWLALDGSLGESFNNMLRSLGMETLLPSVRSGLEMAFLSIAAQRQGRPLHLALNAYRKKSVMRGDALLALNGIVTRRSASQRNLGIGDVESIQFPSWKVKVGHQSPEEDRETMLDVFQHIRAVERIDMSNRKIRIDANQAWNDSQAIQFASSLDGVAVRSLESIEFIEEPLQCMRNEMDAISLADHIENLERWYRHTAIPYALDETMVEVARLCDFSFESIKAELQSVFRSGITRGCAAWVLKPAILGLELSILLGRLARKELGIGAVFSSCFDSGLGLAYAAMLAAECDRSPALPSTKSFAHGVGTFALLGADTLVPAFGSYVNENGWLNVASLSRSLYGLGLAEIKSGWIDHSSPPVVVPVPASAAPQSKGVASARKRGRDRSMEDRYESSTATSSSGREIHVVVSLPLPFSADIATSRFTDLPQQPRWSPWISSVSYLAGKETEWTLNVRGLVLKWRATSQLLKDPYPGIQWESVSGLKNHGRVEFVPNESTSSSSSSSCTTSTTRGNSCQMNVYMTLVPPAWLGPLLQGPSSYSSSTSSLSVWVEDFLRDKLLKWSLEMFRDVVKADLAVERGDMELGDALYGSVEGRVQAIEATLGPGNTMLNVSPSTANSSSTSLPALPPYSKQAPPSPSSPEKNATSS